VPGVVIADYLNTTHPLGSFPFARDAVLPVLEEAGASQCTDELYDLGLGKVRIYQTPRVGVISLSGAALAQLRDRGVYGEYLAALGTEAHKVTILHAAFDQRLDAPPRIQALFTKAKRGLVSLSRKALDPRRDVEGWLKPGVLDGRQTGGVYLAPPTARVRGCVYDKRDERLRAGFPDPGPLLRHELRTKNVGATLRDAYDPTRLFWHYMAPDLLRKPQDVPDWSPQADGYDLPPMRVYSPQERVQRIVDNSLDLARLFDLAASLGPQGLDIVTRAIKARYSRYLASQTVASGGPEGTERSVPSEALGDLPGNHHASTLQ
jgi:hypothetical protein